MEILLFYFIYSFEIQSTTLVVIIAIEIVFLCNVALCHDQYLIPQITVSTRMYETDSVPCVHYNGFLANCQLDMDESKGVLLSKESMDYS